MSHDIASPNVARKVSKQAPKFKKRTRRGTALAAAVAGLGFFGSNSVHAAHGTRTWTGAANSNWDATSVNWDNSGTATAWTTSDAVFDGTGTGLSLTVDNSGGLISVGDMTFSAGGYNISGDTLTLVAGNTTAGTSTLNVGSGLTATISAVLDGTSGVTVAKAGNGTLVLNGNNTYAGGTSLAAGTLSLGNDNALGTGSLAFNGGTIQSSGGSRTIGNAVNFGGDVTVAGVDNFTFSGINTLTGDRTVTVSNTGVTTINALGEDITGGRALSKAGGGTLVLTGIGAYTGTTTIFGGEVQVNGSLASASAVTLTGGSLRGTGTVNGTVSLSGASIIDGGVGSTIGTLHTGALSLGAGSTVAVHITRRGESGGQNRRDWRGRHRSDFEPHFYQCRGRSG